MERAKELSALIEAIRQPAHNDAVRATLDGSVRDR